ncbi:hypothetical protein H4Q26_000541 [Puccinia striiformis f. sp. tritici PST-130]|nr:hypothetical protein H4Q26_000541 [Puccinia striiformis f. sp. tritici PST-130]
MCYAIARGVLRQAGGANVGMLTPLTTTLNPSSHRWLIPHTRIKMSYVAKGGEKDYEAGGLPPPKSHRIRITLTSKNVKALEKVCFDLVSRAKTKIYGSRAPFVSLPSD